MFGVSRAIVFRWQQKYDEGGPAALETKKTPGPGYSARGQAVQALAAEITPAGGTAPAIGADLRRPQAPSQLVQAAAETPGPADVLCWPATTG